MGAAPSEQTLRVDPITLATVVGTLDTSLREMSITMRRVAMSPVLAIGNDFSNAIFDGQPRMLDQGHDQPVHIGAMIFACKQVADYFQGDLRPGDVIYHNDPRTGGSHLPDMTVYKPVFIDDQLMFWTANRSHMNETGGPLAGGYNPHATEVWAEGLRISPIKLYESGRARYDIIDFLLTNFRTRRQFRGDLSAQVAACTLAEQRLRRLVTRYGAETVISSCEALLDRAERLMRMEIGAMPDGTYKGSSVIEDDGHGSGELMISATVRIQGESIHVKLEAPPQTNSYINSYASNSMSAVYLGLLTYVSANIPHNEGVYRPVTVDLGPKGTMVNAEEPAACGLSTSTPLGHVAEAVRAALAEALPERAGGGWGKVCMDCFSGTDPRTGEAYAYLSHLTSQGGGGAFWGQDGEPAIGAIEQAGAARTGEVELIEYMLPFHVRRHELREDSGCPGRWRGGWGLAVEIEPIDHDVQLSIIGDGMKHASPSLLGGGSESDGDRAFARTIHAPGGQRDVSLHSVAPLRAGEVLEVFTAGGGGVGPAKERALESVIADWRGGLLSTGSAMRDYGVEIGLEFTPDGRRRITATRAEESAAIEI